jgi:hypothetical protein
LPAQPAFSRRLRFGQDDRSFLGPSPALFASLAVGGIDLRQEKDLSPDQFAPSGGSKLFDPIGRLVHERHFTTEPQRSQSFILC